MSLHHHLTDQAVRFAPQASFVRKDPQQMRIAIAIPGQDHDETHASEGVGDPQEAIDRSRQRVEKAVLQPPERDAMLAVVPSLRAFAMSLCGNLDRADDLVQETLLRATANISSFEPGTNMPAWLFTILRNQFRRMVNSHTGMFVPGSNELMLAVARRSVSCTRSSARSRLPHNDIANARKLGTTASMASRSGGCSTAFSTLCRLRSIAS